MNECNDFYENPFKVYDTFDHMYVSKYLLNSFDLKLTSYELNILISLNDKFILLVKGLKQFI